MKDQFERASAGYGEGITKPETSFGTSGTSKTMTPTATMINHIFTLVVRIILCCLYIWTFTSNALWSCLFFGACMCPRGHTHIIVNESVHFSMFL